MIGTFWSRSNRRDEIMSRFPRRTRGESHSTHSLQNTYTCLFTPQSKRSTTYIPMPAPSQPTSVPSLSTAATSASTTPVPVSPRSPSPSTAKPQIDVAGEDEGRPGVEELAEELKDGEDDLQVSIVFIHHHPCSSNFVSATRRDNVWSVDYPRSNGPLWPACA